MTIYERIAIVLDSSALPRESDLDEWAWSIEPWRDRLHSLYEEHKKHHDFATSSHMARAQVVQEMLSEDKSDKRPETGPMRFGDDWPGVFIRGDSAVPLAMYIEAYLAGSTDPLTRMYVQSVANLLRSCDARFMEGSKLCQEAELK